MEDVIEQSILEAQCENCHKTWAPYGSTKQTLPTAGHVICPHCGKKQFSQWFDSETKKKLTQKNLGLADSSSDVLQKKFDLLEKEFQIEKGKRELLEIKLKQIEEWMKNREDYFQTLERWISERETKDFRENLR